MMMAAAQRWILICIIVLGVILIILKFARHWSAAAAATEGFTQSVPFVMKRGDEAYDDFYSEIHRGLFYDPEYVAYCVDSIEEITKPSHTDSRFLDAGCGTGPFAETLVRRGYSAVTAIDKSAAMIKQTVRNAPEARTVCADFMDTSLFDTAEFSHIVCMFYTIYYVRDKVKFFKNCRRWLEPNGFLIVHLVSRAGGAPVSSRGRGFSYRGEIQTASGAAATPAVIWKEEFQDAQTKAVRQHEKVLFMEDEEEIVNIAAACDFAAVGAVDLEPAGAPAGEFIYFFRNRG